jgi:hypothetical protein
MKIRNLTEFLAYVGGDNAYQAGRGLYKYTDCGPWITYLVEDREVYYESDEANTITECSGIKMGSIVEGSEAYVDREPMMFPFTGKEFDAYVKSINDEASFYWERDNLDHYMVRRGKREYFVAAGWGEELKLPKKLRETVAAFLQNNELEEGQTITIPATKIEIEKLSTGDWGY